MAASIARRITQAATSFMQDPNDEQSIEVAVPYRSPKVISEEMGVTSKAYAWLKPTSVSVAILGLVGWGLVSVINKKTPNDATSSGSVIEVKKQDFGNHVREFSMHRGGSHVLESGGHVRFLKEHTTVEDDDARQSPYGLWGPLGTRSRSK